MTVDLATLWLEVESSEAKAATDDLDGLTGAAKRSDKAAQNLSKSHRALGATLRSVARVAAGALAAVFSVQAAATSIRAARDFGSALSETSTLIEGTAQEMEFLEDRARSLAREFGGSATQQVEGFYQAISAGASNVEDAAEILESANKLAIGGATNVTTGVDVLTTAVNAYALSGLSAADASDALFVGIRAGKTDADQLGASIGKILPITSQLGITFDETVASIAALTKGGIRTSEAVTGMKAVMQAILKPTSQAADEAERLGLEFNAQALASKGLVGFLEDVIDKTGGSQESMAELFSSSEALVSILAFTGAAGQDLIDILGDMEEKVGATQEAYNKMAEDLNQRLIVQLAKLADVALVVGVALLSTLVPAMEFVSENAGTLGAILFGLAATQLPALVISLTAATTAMGLYNAITLIANVSTKAFLITLRTLGGPIGVAVGLLATLGALVYNFAGGAKEAADKTDSLTVAIDTQNQAERDLQIALDQVRGGNDAAAESAVTAANANLEAARAAHDRAIEEVALAKAIVARQTVEVNAARAAAEGGGNIFFSQELIAQAEEDFAGAKDYYDQTLDVLSDRGEAIKRAVTLIEETASVLGEDALNLFSPDRDLQGGGGDVITPDVVVPGLPGSEEMAAEFDSRLEQLRQGLMTEREFLDEWYNDAQEILTDRRSMEILGEEQHAAAKLEIERLYQEEVARIQRETQDRRLGEMASFFGSMADIASQGGDRLVKITKVFGAIEALLNTYRAQAQVLADPTLGFWGKLAAYAAIGAAGLRVVTSLRSGGGSSGSPSFSGGTGSGSQLDTGNTQEQNQEPQRVMLEFPKGSILTPEMMSNIFDEFYKENGRRGQVFSVAEV